MLWACSWQILIAQDQLGQERWFSRTRSLVFPFLHQSRRDFISRISSCWVLLSGQPRSFYCWLLLAACSHNLFSREHCFKQGSPPCSWNPLQDSINQKSHPWLGASQLQTTAPCQHRKRLEQSSTPSEITSNRRNWGLKDLPLVIATHRQRWSNRGLKSTSGSCFHISLTDTWGPLQYMRAGTHVLSIAPRDPPPLVCSVFVFCFVLV